MTLKLGKTPARTDAVKLKFSAYANLAEIPTPPAAFGHETIIPTGKWGMLGNDQYGDCVWAGQAHMTMAWNALGGHPVDFNDACVLRDYSDCTGFNRDDPSTDQGTDMQKAADYWRNTGIIDAHGIRHKIAAYLALEPGNLKQLLQAMWLFNGVGIGIEVPDYAMDQFNKGQPWDVISGPHKIEGGHLIPGEAERGNLVTVTWAALQQMTPRFFGKFCDEAVVYLTKENLVNGKSPELFDYASLEADLPALKAA